MNVVMNTTTNLVGSAIEVLSEITGFVKNQTLTLVSSAEKSLSIAGYSIDNKITSFVHSFLDTVSNYTNKNFFSVILVMFILYRMTEIMSKLYLQPNKASSFYIDFKVNDNKGDKKIKALRSRIDKLNNKINRLENNIESMLFMIKDLDTKYSMLLDSNNAVSLSKDNSNNNYNLRRSSRIYTQNNKK
jgi:hypothetical protein